MSMRGVFSEGVARNAGSLYAIQIASYVLPIASFPYLTRTLGPERYGIYVLVLAVARYGLILTDWGFNYSATRALSVVGRAPSASSDGRECGCRLSETTFSPYSNSRSCAPLGRARGGREEKKVGQR